MKKLLVCLILCIASTSYADSGAPLDAGVSLASAGSGSGSAVAAVPAPIDPTADPSGFLKQLADLYHGGGWILLILFGVYGLCELVIAGSKNVPWLSWLAKGRASIVIGGLASVAVAAIAALTHAGSWGAVVTALVVAYSLYAHPAATDVAIARAELPKATLVKG